MANSVSKTISFGVIFVAGISGCSGLNPDAKSAAANGMNTDQYSAAYDIAAARCDRQTNACSSFSSRSDCISAKLRLSAEDTRLPHCSNDIDRTKVRACVAEIERGQCGTGIAQLDACRESQLCPYVSEEGTL